MTECEWCGEPATWRFDAQWSWFDFDYAVACEAHAFQGVISLARRFVDGQPVGELFSQRLEEASVPSDVQVRIRPVD